MMCCMRRALTAVDCCVRRSFAAALPEEHSQHHRGGHPRRTGRSSPSWRTTDMRSSRGIVGRSPGHGPPAVPGRQWHPCGSRRPRLPGATEEARPLAGARHRRPLRDQVPHHRQGNGPRLIAYRYSASFRIAYDEEDQRWSRRIGENQLGAALRRHPEPDTTCFRHVKFCVLIE